MIKKASQIIRELFGRRWWGVTLLVILVMAGLARLGIWQLDRLQQRRERNEVLAATLAQNPIDLVGDPIPHDVESIKNRQVTATGTYDFENQVMLKVQNWQGTAGAHLITPLIFDDGETVVLVDRGWIPETDNNPASRPKYNIPGDVTVQGFVALSESLANRSEVETEGPQEQWYRVDIEGIQKQLPYELMPFYVIQAPDDNSEPPFRVEPEVDLSEGNHFSYAMQWFIFSIGLGIGYVLFVNKQMGEKNVLEA